MPLSVGGVEVGDLITVGHRVVLFTAKAALRKFDGMIFGSADDAVAALRSVLGAPEPPDKPAAGQILAA